MTQDITLREGVKKSNWNKKKHKKQLGESATDSEINQQRSLQSYKIQSPRTIQIKNITVQTIIEDQEAKKAVEKVRWQQQGDLRGLETND